MQTDPIEGGADNNYVYPTDPVNFNDLSGEAVPVLAGGMIAAAIGNAMRIVATRFGVWAIKNFTYKVHGAHHSWYHPRGIKKKAWRYHIEVKHRKTHARFQVPFGPNCYYRNCKPGPKGLVFY